MAIHERVTTLRATEVHADVLYVGDVRHTNLNPDLPEETPLPEAPAPLPEKLTMAALAEAHNALVAALIDAGVLAPHPTTETEGEPA